MFDAEYTANFWKDKWYLALFFVVVLAGLNVYFGKNWKLFTFLESENWSELITHLEHQVMIKKKLTSRKVQLLLNTYLLHSTMDSIKKFSEFIDAEKPKLKERFVLQFGVPFLVENDPKGITDYFGKYIEVSSIQSNWIDFCYSFGLILQKNIEDGKTKFFFLLEKKPSALLTLLSLYLLDSILFEDNEEKQKIIKDKEEFSRKYTKGLLDHEVSKNKTNIVVIVLMKVITQAVEWLYPSQSELPVIN